MLKGPLKLEKYVNIPFFTSFIVVYLKYNKLHIHKVYILISF